MCVSVCLCACVCVEINTNMASENMICEKLSNGFCIVLCLEKIEQHSQYDKYIVVMLH